jgi:flagellar hook-length control protein FliK
MSLARNADSSEWGNGLSERVSWMINQKQNSASIRLDPPALGRLEVQIKIVDDATTISIQTQTLQTRDLIEAASTRLRDFLQESGYQNVNVDVSQRQDQQQARAQTMANSNPDQDDSAGQEQSSDHEQPQHAGYFRGDGLVDTFA